MTATSGDAPKTRTLLRGRKKAKPARPARRRRLEPAPEIALADVWNEYRQDPRDELRNALVSRYRAFVGEIVRRFANRLPRRVDRGDLDTAAHVGLMSAISGYDPTRGVRFESYCERRVRGALIDELRSQDWLPRPWRHRVEQHKRVVERLRAEGNCEPRDEEVAREMEMSLDEYELVFGTGLPGAPPGAKQSAGGGDEGQGSILEAVADTRLTAPGEQITQEELMKLVSQRLTQQEYQILYMKYWQELPMREIGLVTGLSESRVCKIHARLLDRLKDRFAREG